MSKPKADIVARLLDWAYTICTVNSHVPPSSKAQMAREAAAEITRLRADLSAANAALAEARRMISEINDENERLSAELSKKVEELAAAMRKEGGGA